MTGITCVLCGQSNKKHCDSHIFPQWMFKFLQNKASQNPVLMFQAGKFPIGKSKGLHKKIGLCVDCDNRIGVYDEYMKSFVEKDFSNFLIPNNGNPFFKVPNSEYDYEMLKKFFASLLWRASLHQGNDFKDVNLGQKYSELCIKYLNGKIDDISDIKISISKLKSTFPGGVENILLPIGWNRDKNGLNEYILTFCGLKIICIVDKRMNSELPDELKLSKENLIMSHLNIEDCAEWQEVIRVAKLSKTK